MRIRVQKALLLDSLLYDNPCCSLPLLVFYRRQQTLKKAIESYKPEINVVKQAKVLLIGPVGAGKSSFFNSINSAFRGNMTCQAIAGTADRSVTNQVPTANQAKS